MSRKRKEVSIDYQELRKWLACPKCHTHDAKIEEGSMQLFCPVCKERQNLIEE